MIFQFIISILSAYGLAIAVVQKGDKFPVKLLVNPLRNLIHWINPEATEVLECAPCFSFWAAILTSSYVMIFHNHPVSFLPLHGLISLGLTWTIYEALPQK